MVMGLVAVSSVVMVLFFMLTLAEVKRSQVVRVRPVRSSDIPVKSTIIFAILCPKVSGMAEVVFATGFCAGKPIMRSLAI